jgi:hypothetical protein
MSWADLLLYAGVGTLGILASSALVRLVWRIRSALRLRKAGRLRLLATRHRVWQDPRAAAVDMRWGPGGQEGAPVPPFTFVEEHHSGSQPCVAVRDARRRLWRVKWGHEARPEAFAVRLAHACGYFAEVTHYVAEGTIDGANGLTRARHCIAQDGRFSEARFEREDRSVRMIFGEHSWAWNDNPFLGTPQLSGLKILVMLLSNWDTKDRRDVARGSNTAIFEHRVAGLRREARYLITDWGGAMGTWGTNVISRGRWDADGFEAQTPQFVAGVEDGLVRFGYVGQRTADVAEGIPVEHVRWFFEIADRVTESHVREGLLASGATGEEAVRFARAIRRRIDQLGEACGTHRVAV